MRRLKPGDSVEIIIADYNYSTGELEIYPAESGSGWWGIEISNKEADKFLSDLKENGQFLYKDVKHILIPIYYDEDDLIPWEEVKKDLEE